MKILVLGDRIIDQYSFCKATRLCPEAPAPVLVVDKQRTSEGGAALVGAQLKVLAGSSSVVECYGSVSEKHRIFADRTMICRIDRDSQSTVDQKTYWTHVQHLGSHADAIVVGDYGKGAIKSTMATSLVRYCEENSIPLFVDAKSDPVPYKDAFAIFPNEGEHNGLRAEDYQNIIRKLGPLGCSVNGQRIGTDEQQVYDVTGAGDVFLAAFVYKWLLLEKEKPTTQNPLLDAAKYANKVAGLSVRHLGTYIVPLEDINR